MCGLVTLISELPMDDRPVRLAMEAMHRRGPDGQGCWQGGGVCMGHRRLSIIDLEERAAQPMHSPCGRYTMVYNGEIYNFRDLRGELEAKGDRFRTTSDTEVLLALFAREGEAMLPRLHGMFAFVIWDSMERRAFAARDPYGIKPMYVADVRGGVLLASQVKALMATGLVDDTPDPMGQAGFWMLGSVPEPHTWYRSIRSLPAGHLVWIEEGRLLSQRRWFDVSSTWLESTHATIPDTTESGIRSFVRNALMESVDRHLVSDVPVGVFLSGGIDSGALAGLMKERGADSLTGVTVAFDEFAGLTDDEAPVAAEIARHYGIRHHVRKVTREEFLSDLPSIFDSMDQPSIDGINTWYASKAVADLGLKVVVSGVGGDELFLGYRSFRQLPLAVSAWGLLSRVPGLAALASAFSGFQARRTRNARWHHAPQWLTSIPGAWWLRRSTMAPESAEVAMGVSYKDLLKDFTPEVWLDWMTGPLAEDPMIALAQIESTTYLRNQLLRDSDWASMGHSVELRTPLVDARLLSVLKPVLPHLKRFPGKSLLAQAPSKAMPEAVVRRRKTGFSIPVNQWMAAHTGKGGSWQAVVAGQSTSPTA